MCKLTSPARAACTALMLLALLAGAVLGGEPAEDDAIPWYEWDRLTGDWFGARTRLEDDGIEFEASASFVWQALHKGGLRSIPGGKLTADWDAELSLDTEKLGLWPGGTFGILAEGSKGTGIDERYVDSLIGVNDDDGDYSRFHAEVTEYFYEHEFSDKLTVRGGMIDGGRDLEGNLYADEYSSNLVATDRTPFPDYGPGLEITAHPTEWLSVAFAGVYIDKDSSVADRDAEFVKGSDWFFAGEVGFKVRIPAGDGAELPGNYRFGAWHDTVRYERLDNERLARGTEGFYISFDQMIYLEAGGVPDAEEDGDGDDEDEDEDECPQGMGVFLRYSYSPSDSTEIEHMWHAGGQYTGIIPGRDRDALGVGMALAQLGGPSSRDTRYDHETIYELYYSIPVSPSTKLTLDLQYVQHPGAEDGSCIIPGFRLEFDF